MEPLQLQEPVSTRTAEEPNRNEPISCLPLPSFWNRCESMRTTGTLLMLQSRWDANAENGMQVAHVLQAETYGILSFFALHTGFLLIPEISKGFVKCVAEGFLKLWKL